jgi:hypothetical protein
MEMENHREKWMRWSEMKKHLNVRDQIRLRNEYRKKKRQERSRQVIHQAKIKECQEENEE